MNKNLLPVLALLSFTLVFLTNTKKAKAQAFSEGATTISAGYGLISLPNVITSDDAYDFSSGSSSAVGPIYLKFEKAVAPHVGFGLNLAYVNLKQTDQNNGIYPYGFQDTYILNSFSVLARFNFHFGKNPKFDPYVGLGLGYVYDEETFKMASPYGSSSTTLSGKDLNPYPIGAEITIGARYYITPGFGIYAETGLAKSIFQLGFVVALRNNK